MPHISKKRLNKNAFDKLYAQLIDIVAQADTTDARGLLTELLTETEKAMLIKRVAAVVMLSEGYSEYAIWKTLNLSSSTIAKIHLAFNAGHYGHVISIFEKKKRRREEFWETLEVLLRLGMPSMGKDRWKHWG